MHSASTRTLIQCVRTISHVSAHRDLENAFLLLAVALSYSCLKCKKCISAVFAFLNIFLFLIFMSMIFIIYLVFVQFFFRCVFFIFISDEKEIHWGRFFFSCLMLRNLESILHF